MEIIPIGATLYKVGSHWFSFHKRGLPYTPRVTLKFPEDGRIEGASVYINDLSMVQKTDVIPDKRISSIQRLFVRYTSGTKYLLKKSPLMCVLSGGMAVKLFLGKNASKLTKNTDDFDFKFYSHRPIETQKQKERYGKYMSRGILRHIYGFGKWLTRNGYKCPRIVFSDYIKGVVLPSPSYGYKKGTYMVSRVTVDGEDLIDASLVFSPIKFRVRQLGGFLIQDPKTMVIERIDVLKRSFTENETLSRNPIFGKRKIKGLKNVSRLKNLGKITHLAPHVKEFIKAIEAKNIKKSTNLARV